MILVKGWGVFDEQNFFGDQGVLVVEGAPYESLFPFVKAIIHHGGIGTISACLRAGKPFLSCPVLYPLGDQFFWSKIGAQKGVGLGPIPLKKATVPIVLKAVYQLVNDESLHINAQSIKVKLSMEDGVKEAIRIIEGDSQN